MNNIIKQHIFVVDENLKKKKLKEFNFFVFFYRTKIQLFNKACVVSVYNKKARKNKQYCE